METIKTTIFWVFTIGIILAPYICASVAVFASHVIYKNQKNIFTSAMYKSSVLSSIILILISIITAINIFDFLEGSDYDGFAVIASLFLPIILAMFYVIFSISLFLLIYIMKLLVSPKKKQLELIVFFCCMLILVTFIGFAEYNGITGPYKILYSMFTDMIKK